jgi:hypothetical protein
MLCFEDVRASAMWPRIVAIAEDYDPGCRIPVTDRSVRISPSTIVKERCQVRDHMPP